MTFAGMRRNLSTLISFMNKETVRFREEVTTIVRDYLTGRWKNVTPDSVIIKKLRGGLNNWLFQISLPQTDQKLVEEEPKTVLLRFHQPLDPEFIFEHVSESLAFLFLSERKLGPKLLGVFPGGRIEEYIDARPLRTDEMGNINLSLAIAERMAEIHSLNAPLSKKNGTLFDLMEKWLLIMEKESADWKINTKEIEKCVKYFKSHDLISEVSWLRNFLSKLNSPVLFCHNDLQEGNILVTHNSVDSKTPKIAFIDYEYCFYNYRGFEFANHFLEYTISYEPKEYPNFAVDESNYPSPKQQLRFIRRYLSVMKRLQQVQKEKKSEDAKLDSATDDDVIGGRSEDEVSDEENQLLREISDFRLASHLLWGIWAALRCESEIKFCYWEYCFVRLEAYFRTKEEIKSSLALK